MISIIVAILAAITMVWSLMGMLRHKLNEIEMGSSIVAKLLSSEKGNAVIKMLRHPLLPLSKAAADMPERKSMMSSYWKSGLYGIAFLLSTIVFAAGYQGALG